MNIKDIRGLFEELERASKKPEEIVRLCERYLFPKTPTYELGIMKATVDVYNLVSNLKDPKSGLPLVKRLANKLTEMLHKRGYRNNIETHQEHCLVGSSGSGITPDEKKFPHTVCAILNGEISVDEARTARRLEQRVGIVIPRYWGVGDESEYFMLLPDIDSTGVTIKDPSLIDPNGNIVAEKLIEDAPYKR